jgi:hypothetical protein
MCHSLRSFKRIPKSSVMIRTSSIISNSSKLLQVELSLIFISFHNSFLRSDLCGYNVSLTYPQNGIIPSIPLILPTQRDIPYYLQSLSSYRHLKQELTRRYLPQKRVLQRRRENLALRKKDFFKIRANGTIDPWVSEPDSNLIIAPAKHQQYGCFLFDEFIDYAVNYTFPWSEYICRHSGGCSSADVRIRHLSRGRHRWLQCKSFECVDRATLTLE